MRIPKNQIGLLDLSWEVLPRDCEVTDNLENVKKMVSDDEARTMMVER